MPRLNSSGKILRTKTKDQVKRLQSSRVGNPSTKWNAIETKIEIVKS